VHSVPYPCCCSLPHTNIGLAVLYAGGEVVPQSPAADIPSKTQEERIEEPPASQARDKTVGGAKGGVAGAGGMSGSVTKSRGRLM